MTLARNLLNQKIKSLLIFFGVVIFVQWRYWCYSYVCSSSQFPVILFVMGAFFLQFTFQKKRKVSSEWNIWLFFNNFSKSTIKTIEKDRNMFKENNEDNKTTLMTSSDALLLTLNIFHSFFLAFLLLTLNR